MRGEKMKTEMCKETMDFVTECVRALPIKII